MSSHRPGQIPEIREQIDRARSVTARIFRFWWLMGALAVVGALLAIGFSVIKGRTYRSETVIMYQEIIPTKILQSSDAVGSGRDMAGRFRELARSSKLLLDVVEDNGLLRELHDDEGPAAVVDEMRKRLRFTSRGGGTFHLSYVGSSPENAQDVTRDIAQALIRSELSFRKRGVEATRGFLEGELERAEEELHERELALAGFMAKHPEFAEESGSASSSAPGASIRARRSKESARSVAENEDDALVALKRQRNRIRTRLSGGPTTAETPDSPEMSRARADLKEASNDLDDERRKLSSARSRYTERHPDVIHARGRVEQAERRIDRAREKIAALKRVAKAQVPRTEADRDELEKQLDEVNKAIASRRASRRPGEPSDQEGVEGAVIELETQWTRLNRTVEDARERLEVMEGKSFTAEIMAASELGGKGAQLEIIDPASKPTRPAGMPRKLLAMAGFVAFGGLGFALALVLAVSDDRLLGLDDFRRHGLDEPIAVVPKSDRWSRD